MAARTGVVEMGAAHHKTPNSPIDISYAAEIGKRKENSWKGGTLGHGVEVEPGESIVQALARLYATNSTYEDATFLPETLKPAVDRSNGEGE